MNRHLRYILLALAVILASFAPADEPRPTDHQAAVLAAARRYRIQVYQSFRQDRQTYDQRIRLGERVLDAWAAGGSRLDEANVVELWFQHATRLTRQNNLTPPKMPRLAAVADLASPSERTQSELAPVPPPARPAEEPRRSTGSVPVGPDDPHLAPAVAETDGDRFNFAGQPPFETELDFGSVMGPTFLDAFPFEAAAQSTDQEASANREQAEALRPRETGGLTISSQPTSHLPAADGSDGEFDSADHDPSANAIAPSIDLQLLETRIATFNAELTFFEISLQKQPNWSSRELEHLAEQIEESIQHGELSRMYLDLLPLSVRDSVGELHTLKKAANIFDQRVLESRQMAEQNIDLDAIDELDALAERTRQWTTAP